MNKSIKIILTGLLFLNLIGCAEGNNIRAYKYNNENIDESQKALIVTRIFNKASYGLLNSSVPNLLGKLTQGGSSNTEVNVGAKLHIGNNENNYILGDPKNKKDMPTNTFSLVGKVFNDADKQFMYNPDYDVVIVEPGSYNVTDIEVGYFNFKNIEYFTREYSEKPLKVNLKAGDVIYLGDIEINSTTGDLKISNELNNAVNFMDNKYPELSHRLKYKKFE